MTELINVINSFQELDYETEEAIKKYFIVEKFKKGELVVETGYICKKIYFIKSGAVRPFYIEDGKEVTKWICTEINF
ncbi:hypothetical protein AB9T88_03965 [Flavobacterium sp. LBUM151]